MRHLSRALLVLLLMLLLPGMALAQATWVDCADGKKKSNVGNNSEICADFTTANLTTNLLYIGGCKDNFDVIYNADQSGTGTTMNLKTMLCTSPVASTATCNLFANEILSGAASSFSQGGVYGSYAYWIGENNPGSETPRVLVHCN
jgi:hypothetical protein